ncbi:hypothetical protein [Hoeflea ulvae]|uniref:Nucleotidyltransferase n=1 Tax=Hoeflea ulvae TaxID=2983764 RepID=A0ABT3YKJ1_9HYPH|nr:hypothetical protein [Hoeflea ulvae]MCY0096414.1 hypothetical protein [Hoeflea ulvae]
MPYPPVILWPDADGFVQPMASLAAIQPAWRAPLDEIAATCRSACGNSFHSLYIRGSVALGQARDRLSDIDAILLSEGNMDTLDKPWRDRLGDRISRSWPFVQEVELLPASVSSLRQSDKLCALLKTQSVCYAGADVTAHLQPRRLGLDLVFEGWSLPNDIALARKLQTTPKAGKARSWMARKILRSSFELVMCEAGCYTRDLSACRACFLRVHPDQAPMLNAAFDLALGRISEQPVFAALADFGTGWLYPEICRTYGADLITRNASSAVTGAP